MPPDGIRGCRRQQETVREIAHAVSRSPTCPFIGAEPTCPSDTVRTSITPQREPMNLSKSIFLPRKDTKPHERRQRVNPKTIRAEHSEQKTVRTDDRSITNGTPSSLVIAQERPHVRQWNEPHRYVESRKSLL
ncbi:MAG TPA: hypothetical protein DCY03_26135 [Planctomycetaceae bacterium]|nr:hypothetical protein [Planctomycetaceae bacterium]